MKKYTQCRNRNSVAKYVKNCSSLQAIYDVMKKHIVRRGLILAQVAPRSFWTLLGWRHMKERTLARDPMDVSTCGKKFTLSAHLRKHHKIHTNEKPYACHLCDKKFSDKSSLDIHGRVHSDDKPFDCKTCGKKFKSKQHLRCHERTHSLDRQYHCSVCNLKFKTAMVLKKHTTRKHLNPKSYQSTRVLVKWKLPR